VVAVAGPLFAGLLPVVGDLFVVASDDVDGGDSVSIRILVNPATGGFRGSGDLVFAGLLLEVVELFVVVGDDVAAAEHADELSTVICFDDG
jgi:hypothetical protein